MSGLFSPFSIRGMTLKNRIVMSPMAQYSCEGESGQVNDWHRVHYTARAVGQVGLIIVEATSVTAQGRITPDHLGIWSDDHVEGLRRLVSGLHRHGAKAGIQLVHAGRKGGIGGTLIAPSAIPFGPQSSIPEAMNGEQIADIVTAYAEAAARAKAAGFDCLEIHAAHGYLLNQFLSPLSNVREDGYGGDRERRYRLLSEAVEAVKRVWEGPLFVRLSAAEYHPDGNRPEDIDDFALRLKEQGVDLIDCSSGGIVPAQIETYPGYQIPLAERIRKAANIPTGAVGLISSPQLADAIIRNGQADLVFLGRELMRDPYWARRAAKELGHELEAPKPYARGWL